MSDPPASVPSVRVPNGAVTEGVRAFGRKEAQVDREKMLDVALTQIEKQYGKGAVMKLGEHPAGQGISVIPTGSMAQTLWGYQKVVKCPDCGISFPVNCSSEVDPSDGQIERVVQRVGAGEAFGDRRLVEDG